MPVLIPANMPIDDMDELLLRVDGLVLSGGGDIEPTRFGGEEHKKVANVDLQRDEIEIQLAKKVIEMGMPFLGICRGLQVVNVALGGNLYTHIPDQIDTKISHANPVPAFPPDHLAHDVEIEGDSRLYKIVKEDTIVVNSRHHQAIKDLGKDLKISALAPDGIIEAVEVPDHPFGLAVQWHPENLGETPANQAIFRALVEAAGI
jgi:putative glutamine amidotransferase